MAIKQVLRRASGGLIGLAVLASGGCGVVAPPLPNAVDDLTLRTIRQIQQDPTLTQDQRRALVRDAVGLEDTPEDNRIADFLLALNIP